MSETPKLTRQQIYERIRETSKEEYIQAEMIRLGFWDATQEKPDLTTEFITRRAALEKQLAELGRKQQLYSDPQKALRELHKARKKAALEKREQTRIARNKARYERAQQWHEKQRSEITYLGAGYSFGLDETTHDDARLQQHHLPQLANSQALATAMGITLNELRFLCFQKEVSRINHYRRFSLMKKNGGQRLISAPMPRLKRAQYWILENILNRVPLHDAAHGFVTGRSILSNALPHVNQAIVVNLDMENFFPTVNYRRVKGVFRQLGYSEQIATELALLTTEPEAEQVVLDGENWFVQQGERFLPQGAPSSPALSNIICRRLDSRMHGMANKLGFTYTRYADDMTFSCADKSANVQQLLWRCKQIVQDEGFRLHSEKTRVMRKPQKQEVTGIVVNEKPSLDRKTLKRFRALLFQIAKDGIEGKRWGAGELMASLEGYANFVAQVAPDKGIPLQKQVTDLKRRFGYATRPGRITALNKTLFRAKAARGEAPRDNWWQAQGPSAPVLELTMQQKQAMRRPVSVTSPTSPNNDTPRTVNADAPAHQPARTSVKWWIILIAIILYFLMRK
ncbi:reverse transcriptase family protein [Citrobacter farmeri]|uniref:RNA-directed DNA polymerase n=1 Tax=Citrobacter amalonaticus Y19 TaxID=1261127 RepID=A0A0F6RFP2_CITAM|nr:reverse transcriptase family protein [Citrobacter amalonaticus]AKE59600.1 DNA polymerase [Citrobacter amalonaticus Y19]EKV5654780.1 RNA-directed DNA polymerase [Citrobacter farmeri]